MGWNWGALAELGEGEARAGITEAWELGQRHQRSWVGEDPRAGIIGAAA